MTEKIESNEVLELTTEIVASYVSNNSVKSGELTQVIQDVYQTLTGLGATQQNADRPKPAVSIKKSINYDVILYARPLSVKQIRMAYGVQQSS